MDLSQGQLEPGPCREPHEHCTDHSRSRPSADGPDYRAIHDALEQALQPRCFRAAGRMAMRAAARRGAMRPHRPAGGER